VTRIRGMGDTRLPVRRVDLTTVIAVEHESISDLGAPLNTLLGSQKGSAAVVVTDRNVGPIWGVKAVESLERTGFKCASMAVEPGEGSKSLEVVATLWEFLRDQRFPRDGVVVAVGGGVVSDLAGFAAATWMRGVRWAICPTTVEAAIDAAIGGKTAINLPGAKNLVGAFHAPALVIIDPMCFSTLSERDYRAGWAESVKHALLEGEAFFAWHEVHADSITARDTNALSELIERNVQFKSSVVAEDPLEETGGRITLNLGHTLGHAIEQCSAFSLRHGECVGLGLIAACRLSTRICGLKADVAERTVALLNRLQLPVRLLNAPAFERIAESMALDKKASAGRLRWVLLEDIGKPVVREDVALSEARDVYQSLFLP